MMRDRFATALAAAALLAGAVQGAQARPPASAPAKPTAAAASPAAASTPPREAADSAVSGGMGGDSPSLQIDRALQQMHLTACTGVVEQATNFLFEGQQANFIAQPLGPDADRWPTVFVIESADPAGGHTRFATLMVAPNCSGMYEQTIYWAQPCNIVRTTVFAKYTGDHVLLKDVTVSDAGAALQVYLTPAGAGCLSIKKELFH